MPLPYWNLLPRYCLCISCYLQQVRATSGFAKLSHKGMLLAPAAVALLLHHSEGDRMGWWDERTL
jgi:hypothetical protein